MGNWPPSAPLVEGRGDRGGEIDSAGSSEGMVDVFEPLNEIAHEGAGRGATGFLAEMGAATEGTGLVDRALAIAQERAGTVAGHGELASSGGAQGGCRDHGFSAGQEGRPSGQSEAAAGRAADALPVHGAPGEFRVDAADFREEGALLIGGERSWHGKWKRRAGMAGASFDPDCRVLQAEDGRFPAGGLLSGA